MITNEHKEQIISDYLISIQHRSPAISKNTIPHPLLYRTTTNLRKGLRIQLYGRPAAGKTALAASIVTWNIMCADHMVLWIDSSHSYPEEYLYSQIPDTHLTELYLTRSYTTSSIMIAASIFDTIIIDDTACLPMSVRSNLGKIASVCSRHNCDLILISQVRRDMFSTGDLVPDTAYANCDIVYNITRSELLDEESNKFRYTCMLKACRGRMKARNISMECDFAGVSLPKLLLPKLTEYNVIKRQGISYIDANNQTFKSTQHISMATRFDFGWLKQHASLLYAIKEVNENDTNG